MIKNKKIGIALIFAILLLACSASVLALGVMPATKNLLVGESTSYQLKVLNNDAQEFTALIDVQGELAKYISVSQQTIKFTKDKDLERITVTINIPEDAKLPEGDHDNYIIIRQESEKDSQIEATLNIASKLTISVPYSDEALVINLYTTNFEKGKPNNFVLETQNMGSKNINEAIPVLEIYSSTNDKLETLTGERISVDVGQKVLTDITWTPEYPNGKYFARAFVIYGDKTATFEKVFSIGSPEVNVDSISANKFSLGGIASLDLIISSTWVEAIDDVYANVDLKKGDATVHSAKTINRRLSSLGKTNLPVFLDTKGLEPGKYLLAVTLHYLGVEKFQTFDIFLDQDSIRLSGASGNVIAKTKEGSGISLLIVIVLVLVILNGVVVYKFVIMKKKE